MLPSAFTLPPGSLAPLLLLLPLPLLLLLLLLKAQPPQLESTTMMQAFVM
jgi:hypothetical protein